MRNTTVKRHGKRRRIILTVLALIALVAAVIGLYAGYSHLRKLALDQSLIYDVDSQVTLTGANMVKPGIILQELGLVNGANLAEIDIPRRRDALLANIPNIRSASISRRLPNGLDIVIEERKPLAKMNVVGYKGATGRVVDAEGVVFFCSRATQSLPTIRESPKAYTRHGKKLPPLGLAALRMLDMCRDGEYQTLGILEVDITKEDYLLATMANYSFLKIAWYGMTGPASEKEHENLVYQLSHLVKAVRSNILPGAIIWNATDLSRPCRIYADRSQSVL